MLRAVRAGQRAAGQSQLLPTLARATVSFAGVERLGAALSALAASPEVADWGGSTAKLLDDDARGDASPDVLRATNNLVESEVLRAAAAEALQDHGVLLDAVELGQVSQRIVEGEDDHDADVEEGDAASLTDEELAVLRQFVLLFGAGHLTALVILLSVISGVGLVNALGVLSAIAGLSGYSLRDFLKGDK